MMGISHVVVGAETLAMTGIAIHKAKLAVPATADALTSVTDFMLGPAASFPEGTSVLGIAYLVGAAALYLVGCLLPDIDTEKSLLGRFVHVPGPHHTWTHTVYWVVLMGILSIWVPILAWLALGTFVHLLWDSPSAMGVAWLWPFQDYITYPSGARVAKGHHLRLYHTGKVSEVIVVLAWTALCVLCIVWAVA